MSEIDKSGRRDLARTPEEASSPIFAAFEALQEFNVPLEEIPDAKPDEGYLCCHQEARVKRYVDYTYDYYHTQYGKENNTSVTISKGLPGYSCNNCNAVSYDQNLYGRFMDVLAGAFASKGDNRLKLEMENRGNRQHSPNARILAPGETIRINPQTP